MDLKSLTDRAKQLLEKRGGTGAAKEDAGELKDIATGSGSLSDKAKAAAEAMKEPGADEVTTPAAPEAPTAPGPGQERTERGGGGGVTTSPADPSPALPAPRRPRRLARRRASPSA